MILFCVPFAGGGIEVFAGWQQELAPVAEVRVAELPGRGARMGDPLIDDMPSLVTDLAEQCEDLSRGAYALLGYSFGAYAAYALALRLAHTGRPPRRLFVGGSRAPFLPPRERPRHRMSDIELTAELRMMNGTTAEVLGNPELMSIYLPILRADFKIIETFPPVREPVPCPLTVFGANRDVHVPTRDLTAWTRLGDGKTEVRIHDGDHFVIRTDRSRICREVRADLALDALNPASRS
ncbi:thioesterase II family protein [Streptomyces sp. ST2-7A]|uniref:thioesterase II family protein n=1 Tax=Streptomyces sp. ST2-7A TaxID=2907214 RepID=UPI001F4890D3|nr:alpha/beta fold hydrolase [Streptomyces sp. ST2-7A]MCE7082628.1 alpha/beta fold hydrolase [Streptomyces sp. ST2-7A]